MTNSCFAFGIGIGTKNANGDWLEVFYKAPIINPSDELIEAIQQANCELTIAEPNDQQWQVISAALTASGFNDQASIANIAASSEKPTVLCILQDDTAPESVVDGFLKLHLLSHRLAKPHSINLNGVFGALRNVAWTNKGAIDLEELEDRQLLARSQGSVISVDSVDKFPKMTDYVVPSGVRIADARRVRLGAYLGEGTTIMHEGFVNFNAGTEGPGMIEGRISSGVYVGKGSDLGGGCSTMGTLSGGNNTIISIGDACLIGANAGVGIPLGDRCTIEAGLYVTGSSKVSVLDKNGNEVAAVKASELAGKSDLLFRRHSRTGEMQCLANQAAIELNAALHAND